MGLAGLSSQPASQTVVLPLLCTAAYGGVTLPLRYVAAASYAQAVLSCSICNSWIIRSRITNFCTLPVTVIGSSSTKRMYFGTL
jgi:hypothetical protein